MPGSLLEHGKGDRMCSKKTSVRLRSLANIGEKLTTEQPGQRFHRLERADSAKELPTIVSCHPHRGDLARPLVEIEIGRTAYVHASVREIHRTLGIVRKAREEVFSHPDHLVGLP